MHNILKIHRLILIDIGALIEDNSMRILRNNVSQTLITTGIQPFRCLLYKVLCKVRIQSQSQLYILSRILLLYIIHLGQLSNLIGPFVPRDRPEKTILDGYIGRLALTLTQKRQRQVELWQNRTVQGCSPIQRSNCCQCWTIRIVKTPKQANESEIRISERFFVEKG